MSPAGAVLVAEDEGPMRALLTAALAKRGYQVEAVNDGDAALAAAANGSFDVALLDMLMPGATGMETLQRLRERFGPSELPVVMVTAVGDSDAVVAALEAGANDYVTKPFDLAVVAARVRTQVTLRRQAAALQEAGSRLREELEAAARVQQAALPPPEPRFGDFQFAWSYEPCEQLSGDGLNIFPVTPRHIGFFVLDVTGHGVRAALLSAAVGRLLLPSAGDSAVVSEPAGVLGRDVATPLTPAVSAVRPSDVAARLARRFRDHPVDGQYFTLLYGLLDVSTGEVVYASAGHPPPILVQPGRQPKRLACGGLMIGVDLDEGPPYRDHTVRLAPGDRLLLHSDGVTEARSFGGEMFGDRRLMSCLAETASLDLSGVLETVSASLRDWTGGGSGDDDRTLLALERVRR